VFTFGSVVAEGSVAAAAAASAFISRICLRFACQIDPANPTTKADPAAASKVLGRIGGSETFFVSVDIGLIPVSEQQVYCLSVIF
jgi:hypothetical protein